MDRNFFGFDKDLNVCFIYIPTQYSSYYIDQGTDFLEMVELDISKYKNMVSVMIMGDFNAESATEDDFIINNDVNYLPLHEDYVIDTIIIPH